MSRITAVSFDADEIRIVTGLRTRRGFSVERTLTLAIHELDAFLASDHSHEYLVAVNPNEAIYKTITIPPVDAKLEAALIRAETSRLHPELLPFSCGWRIMEDIPLEGRTVREVACCLVPQQSLEPLLQPFVRHNKKVRQVVAAPVVLGTLVRAVEQTADPLLCAHDAGTSKLLFLLEDGAVTFSRSITSNERGWDAFDRQNIAMTMDYCFQSLRVRASRILVLNSPQQPPEESGPPPHLEYLKLPAELQAGLPPIVIQEYLVPFLLGSWPMPGTANLLPESYRSAQLQQTVLQRCCQFFVLGCVLLALLIVLQFVTLHRLESSIDNLRRQQGELTAIHQTHQQALAQRNQLLPALNVLDGLLAGPDIPTTLAALNGFAVPQAQLHSLAARRDKETVSLQLTGNVTANGFAAAQERFEAVAESLQRINGFTTGNRQLDPKAQTFTIEAVRKP